MYQTLETLTLKQVLDAHGNEVAVKRDDGAVFTVRRLRNNSATPVLFVRDTRSEGAPAHYAHSLGGVQTKIRAA